MVVFRIMVLVIESIFYFFPPFVAAEDVAIIIMLDVTVNVHQTIPIRTPDYSQCSSYPVTLTNESESSSRNHG